MPIFTRKISLTNFAIATSALGFQVFVLYPWHKRLDEDFEQLKEEHIRILHQGEQQWMGELKGINEQLKHLQGERERGWFWRSKSSS